MKETVLQHAFKTALSMIAFAIVGTLLLSSVYYLTVDPIAENEREARLALFKQVIPQDRYNNDILTTTKAIPADALLGTKKTTQANIALKDGKPVAIILEAIAPDGYAGDIKLLIAINHNGVISGVRTLAHKETPGLGDYINIAKDDWIKIFDGESLAKTEDKQWKVSKDGGKFDYRVGATITPRAVINIVHQTLQYFKAHRKTLFDLSAQAADAKDEQ